MPKMGGPFIPLPVEVIQLLESEHTSCLYRYVVMLSRFFVEEITDTEGIWVAGRISATKHQVAEKICKHHGHFYGVIWPLWEARGVIEVRDGGIYLPKYYKKGQAYIQPLMMQKEINALKSSQGEMQATIQKLLGILSEQREVISTPRASERPDPGVGTPGSGLSEASPLSLLCSRVLKISLSAMNKLISEFYRSIGKKRIPVPVREKSIETFKELMKAGYKPGEIEFALLWIPENAEEPIKHFGIVPHMMEQALEAGRKELEAQEAERKKAELREEQERNRMDENQEREALEAYKLHLSEEKRAALREEALEILEAMPGIKSDMIVQALIDVQENTIIRKQGVDLTPFRVGNKLTD